MINCQKASKNQKKPTEPKAHQLSKAGFATACPAPDSEGKNSSERPYKDLFIYHIEGHLLPGTTLSGAAFIGNWQEDKFSFLFFCEPSEKQVKELLADQPHLTLLDNYSMTYENWQGNHIASLRIGRFHIEPPWKKLKHTAQKNKAPLRIKLDPGVVLGAGTHPTTRGCLEALELLFREKMPRSALDLGTGTGLLALAAARLGCRRNIAVDINLLAARTAQSNIRLNHLHNRVMVVHGDAADFINLQTDLVIANMHYTVIKQLLSNDGFFNKKWYILSGLFDNQVNDLMHQLAQRSVVVLKKWKHDKVWHTLFGGKCCQRFRIGSERLKNVY